MAFTRRLLLAWVFALPLGLLQPRSTWAEPGPCAGVALPGAIDLNGRRLVLNGSGKRTASAFQVVVYVAGLYLPERSRDPTRILAMHP
jgi:hypothetical protein